MISRPDKVAIDSPAWDSVPVTAAKSGSCGSEPSSAASWIGPPSPAWRGNSMARGESRGVLALERDAALLEVGATLLLGAGQ